MIELNERELEALLDQAIKRVASGENFQLVSITKKVKHTDPLHFFEAAKYMNKDRVYWTSTVDEFTIAGVGNVHEITANHDRFRMTEEAWEKIRNEAMILQEEKVPGTGVVTLGGMSFDPRKEQTELWRHYQSSQFAIPAYMLTVYEGKHYFTMNILVNKDDHSIQLANELRNAEEMLFTNRSIPEGPLFILDKTEIEPETWKKSVMKATEEIESNQAQKIVLARELRLKLNKEANISRVLQKLLSKQPNSYVFAFEKESDCFVGATPERLVKVEQDHLLSTCLAGTAPRGKTKEEDKQIGHSLLHDSKNREEHDFVVRMIKEGMKKYCTNVDIPGEPVLYPLKNLQHLYTPVTATLKDGYSIFDIIGELHPTPALGGTPTEASLQFIRDNELLDRGWYGAPVGWLDSNRNGEFAVAIRSGLIQGDEASLFAGCGIVKDSDAEKEYEETNIKFLPMLTVFGG
ncbi:isochorismate synthase [Virgibacillus kimchii]